MTEEVKVMGVVVVVMMEEVVEVVVVMGIKLLNVMVTEPLPVSVTPLSVAVDGNEPPPPPDFIKLSAYP